MAESRYYAVPRVISVERTAFWLAGFCGSAGAAGGCFVGWLYGRDQATAMREVPWYGAAGLGVGVLLGLLVSIGPILALVAVDGRPWASATRCAVLAAAAASVPIILVLLATSGFHMSSVALVFCAAVTALPAGIATICLNRRTNRATRPNRISAFD